LISPAQPAVLPPAVRRTDFQDAAAGISNRPFFTIFAPPLTHAKWLKVSNHIPWRRPIASLNFLLSSHVWRQDHNGFSHQDPGFIDHVVNKKAEIIRVYLPPDANTLLSVTDHCLRSRNYVNVIVAGKQPAPQ